MSDGLLLDHLIEKFNVLSHEVLEYLDSILKVLDLKVKVSLTLSFRCLQVLVHEE